MIENMTDDSLKRIAEALERLAPSERNLPSLKVFWVMRFIFNS